MSPPSSRIPGYYERPLGERLEHIVSLGLLSEDAVAQLRTGGLATQVADRMSENVVSVFGLPFAIALNFEVNGRDVFVPMCVEEPSVVAAASNAARMIRASGGFTGEATASIMTAQVQLEEVLDAEAARDRLLASRDELLAIGDRAIPRMVARGGGCRDLEVRVIDPRAGLVVVHVHLDVGDAMGANMADTVAEAVGDRVHAIAGGQLGLRILSNLNVRRMTRVVAAVSEAAVGSRALADAIVRASEFADQDPYRAVTHNKGIMNGIDAVAVALGQDWRAIEAGAHGYAALSGRYRPLCRWTRTAGGIEGVLELPLAVATVGGTIGVHPGVRAAFELIRVDNARELAVVVASAGLASNLAALRALAGEGIQKGHMRLHRRKHV